MDLKLCRSSCRRFALINKDAVISQKSLCFYLSNQQQLFFFVVSSVKSRVKSVFLTVLWSVLRQSWHRSEWEVDVRPASCHNECPMPTYIRDFDNGRNTRQIFSLLHVIENSCFHECHSLSIAENGINFFKYSY